MTKVKIGDRIRVISEKWAAPMGLPEYRVGDEGEVIATSDDVGDSDEAERKMTLEEGEIRVRWLTNIGGVKDSIRLRFLFPDEYEIVAAAPEAPADPAHAEAKAPCPLAVMDYEIRTIPISSEDYGPQRSQDVADLREARAKVAELVRSASEILCEVRDRSEGKARLRAALAAFSEVRS